MALIEIGDGLFADDVTGEIEGIEPGTDRCLVLARRLLDAQDQTKAWERIEAVCKALLIKEQTEKRAEYDGLIVSVRQNERHEVDSNRFAEMLDEIEAPRDVLLTVIRASKVPAGEIPAEMAACVTHSLTRPFIVAERARKRAP